MKPSETWSRCAEWVGLELAATEIERLERYQDWLGSEAMAAGGLGPGESARLHDRHIGDSLLFAGGFDLIPDRVLDVGSGVGLPGIPLAIVLGSTQFILLDRSGRRVDLLRRVSRILELENVTVEQGEIEAYPKQEIALVSRATFPPDRARELLSPLLLPEGTVVIGGSWNQPPIAAGWNLIEIPPTVLDHTIWLLMMRQT